MRSGDSFAISLVDILPSTAITMVDVRPSVLVSKHQLRGWLHHLEGHARRLRIVRRISDMRHARDPNELLEVLGDELRSVVEDDPWPRATIKFLGSIKDDSNVQLGPRVPQIPLYV